MFFEGATAIEGGMGGASCFRGGKGGSLALPLSERVGTFR